MTDRQLTLQHESGRIKQKFNKTVSIKISLTYFYHMVRLHCEPKQEQ